ncbi:MAG: DNA-processing protein DprA [Pseudomonadota bacterium]
MSVEDDAQTAPPYLVLRPSDPLYPPLLKVIHDPPERLYIRGDPLTLLRPQLAIVGSRKASPAAIKLAREIATELTSLGFGVCSGLALGVDGAAHQGALDAGGVSIGVMATGIDRVYPSRHLSLAQRITSSGCLITELAPGTPPRAEFFPRRNRIVSGLSVGVLVIEAGLPSGSLITARCALEQGREVFAVPWSPLHIGGRGCLQMLREGAVLVQNVFDVVDGLSSLLEAHCQRLPPRPPVEPPAATTSSLLSWIGWEAIGLDELAVLSKRSLPEVAMELSALELSGTVARVAGGYVRSG